MTIKFRVTDVDSGKVIDSFHSSNLNGAFYCGDSYVKDNPDKDYVVVNVDTGTVIARPRKDDDESIAAFVATEMKGL